VSLLKRLRERRRERDGQTADTPRLVADESAAYITGMSALNIPYKGVQCDWHQVDTLKAGREGNFVTHPAVIVGAVEIFGEYGIWDCGEWLRKKGFPVGDYRCATPIRAILDILYHRIVVRKQYPAPLENFRDLMCEGIDKGELRSKLDELGRHLGSAERDIYEKWRRGNEV